VLCQTRPLSTNAFRFLNMWESENDSRIINEMNAVVELNATRRIAHLMARTVEIQRLHLVAGVTLELVLSGAI